MLLHDLFFGHKCFIGIHHNSYKTTSRTRVFYFPCPPSEDINDFTDTVKPGSTDTHLIRTPALYGQFICPDKKFI